MRTVQLAGRDWQWSSADTTCFNYLNSHWGDLLAAVNEVPLDRRKICVQAGGNFGVWPWLLAGRFERVITFEPDPECFECLLVNTKDLLNVEAYRLGLGAQEGKAKIVYAQKRNRGAQYLQYGSGEVDCVPLDGLGLPGLDFLDLDIEGAEALALQGAKDTIAKYKPIIVVEDWRKNGAPGHHVRNGISDISGAEWLERNGYRLHTQISQDKVYLPA